MNHAPEPGGPSPGPPGIDGQILAIWQALRANPDLDATIAMAAIDALLDQRLGPGPVTPVLECGAHNAVLASVLRVLLTGEAG